ncbi:hypothetical protein KSP39_PZI017348 [Platanthera zijinensis]|uniref:Uncharacterized protein n=1 Tax=Platanthera zijinensis TaxID=2320716 RepID=A0AAP0FZE6_9ASPA
MCIGTMMMGHPDLGFPSGPVVNRASLKKASFLQVLLAPRTMKSSLVKRRGSAQPYIKASESSAAVTSNGKTSQGSLKTSHNESTFPTGFEALVLDVCDETNIAELKVKVGDFEMHLKRNIGSTVSSVSTAPPIVSPSIAPPIPSEPMFDSSSVATEPGIAPSKPSSASGSSSAYVSSLKDSKLAVLAASSLSGYALVSSPKVGYFRSGKTVKGVKQPPCCKEVNSTTRTH